MRKIWKWFTKFFSQSVDVVEKVISPSVQVVQVLQTLIDSPITDLLTAVIPGTFDDTLAIKIRQYLPKILIDLKISEECLCYKDDPNAVLQCALKELAKYTPDAQKMYYINIATMLSKYLDDGKLSWNEIAMLVLYTQEKN